eukprot:163-Eustigmatos_ZCMA.PRE.1
MGRSWHPRERHLPGFLPEQDDAGHAQDHGRRQAGRARSAGAPGRRRGPQGRDAALCQRRRQTHHGPVAGRRWRRLDHHRRLR